MDTNGHATAAERTSAFRFSLRRDAKAGLISASVFGKVAWALLLLCGIWIAGCGKPAASLSGPSPNPGAAKRTNAAASSATTAASSNEMVMYRSAFDDSKTGKDPFFPLTTRRERPAAPGQAAKPQRPKLPPSSYLKLTGIWPSKTRPFALINKVIFEPGERGEVAVDISDAPGAGEVQKVQVQCLEIRDRSVVISVEGEPGTKELRMPDKP